jgi:hypothetical protein
LSDYRSRRCCFIHCYVVQSVDCRYRDQYKNRSPGNGRVERYHPVRLGTKHGTRECLKTELWTSMVNVMACHCLVYIYLYSPTDDNTFLCLFCWTRFGDYTTIIRSFVRYDRPWFIYIAVFSLITLFLVVYILVL